jgi:hypothetical protein
MTNMPYGCVESREVRSRAARHGVSPPIRLTSGGVARSVERVDRGLSARGDWCAGIRICRVRALVLMLAVTDREE